MFNNNLSCVSFSHSFLVEIYIYILILDLPGELYSFFSLMFNFWMKERNKVLIEKKTKNKFEYNCTVLKTEKGNNEIANQIQKSDKYL